MFLQDLLDHILHVGIGPFDAHQNPVVYTVLLCGAAVSLLITIAFWLFAEVIASREASERSTSARLGSIFGFLFLIVITFAVFSALLSCLWLAFATSYDRLPFSPPSASAYILFIPASTAYSLAALVMHAILATFCGSVLALLWIIGAAGLLLFNAGRMRKIIGYGFAYMVVLVAVALLVAGWEYDQWPNWSVILLDLFFATTPAGIVSGVFGAARQQIRFRSPVRQRRLERLDATINALLSTTAYGLVIFLHPTAPYWIDLFGVFLVLASMDELVAAFLSIFIGDKTPYALLTPSRWIVTVPAVMVITVLGASGLLTLSIVNMSITQAIWIEAGAAASAYMLFKPSIDVARYNAGRSETQRRDGGDLSRQVLTLLGETFANLRSTMLVTPPVLKAIPASSPAPSNENSSSTEGTASKQPSPLTDSGRAAVRAIRGTLPKSSVEDKLRYQVGAIMLGAAIVYHILVANLQFSSVLNSSLVPLVFGLTALVAGLLQVLNNPLLESPRYVALFLLFVILVVTAIAEIFTLVPLPDPTSLANLNPNSLLASPAFYVTTAHLFVQEALFLMTLGQLGYLYLVIQTSIALERQRMRDPDQYGWREFADDLYGQRRYEDARVAYRNALKYDPSNALAYAGLGKTLRELGDPGSADAFVTARLLLTQALQLDDTHDDLAAVLASVCIDLGDYPQALEAYDRALRQHPADETIMLDKAALLHEHLDSSAEAARLCRVVIKDSPRSTRAYEILVAALRAIGDTNGADEAVKAMSKVTS